MTYLLDVNVLIALLDPDHLHHFQALAWCGAVGCREWATSPTVQNGVIRIMGAANYTAVPFGCSEIAIVLASWCRSPEHVFWSDDLSLFDMALVA